MAVKTATSPLLAAGPPGWVAWGIIAVVSTVVVGAAVNEATRSDSRSTTTTTTTTDTARRTCNRPYSVRFHAQGRLVGGTTGATIGAPPIVKPTVPVTVAEGLALSTATFALLSRSQRRSFLPGKTNLDAWITRLPPAGFLGSKTFRVSGAGGNRYDVDSYGCSPNFII